MLRCHSSISSAAIVLAVVRVPAVAEIPFSLPSLQQSSCSAAAAGAVAVAGDLAVVYIFAVAS